MIREALMQRGMLRIVPMRREPFVHVRIERFAITIPFLPRPQTDAGVPSRKGQHRTLQS